ncbi:MAG: FAD-dependent oxidoreductase [Pseudomonadota bacterium]
MSLGTSRPRVAVVGSGISGLAAAWRLGEQWDVTVFERRSRLGLGAEGVEVPGENGPVRIDVPPRVFNARHYRAMTTLLADVDMPTYQIHQRPHFLDARGRAYLGFDTRGGGSNTRHRLNLGRSGWGWLARHGAELYRWHRFVQSFDATTIDAEEPLVDALDRLGFSASFRDSFLYPMWTLMCTCRYDQLDAFPARPVLELATHFGSRTATLRLKGGTQALEERLSRRMASVRLGCSVRAIEPRGDQVMVRTIDDAEPVWFDHVILATDPHSTARLLRKGPLSSDGALIDTVPLHETRMVLHTDTTMLPGGLRTPVSLHVAPAARRSWATLWMNPIEPTPLAPTLLQSWDPVFEPVDSRVLAERTFYRALMTGASQRAMADLRDRMASEPQRRVWYVGAYVESGVPLLENGVRSAERVVGHLRERVALRTTTAA